MTTDHVRRSLTPARRLDDELDAVDRRVDAELASSLDRFEEEGPHHYFCRPHGLFMMGTVHVGEDHEIAEDETDDDYEEDDE